MASRLPESARSTYALQLADEAKTLVPGMERLAEIAGELRADDLYRLLGFDTWERFCVDYLGVSKSTANRWIAGPKPKSISAGQRVAAAQNAPIVESDALNSAKSSEGVAPASETVPEPALTPPSGKASAGSGPGMPQTRPGVAAPAGPSSGGAGIQPPPRPTGETAAPLSAPPGPFDPIRELVDDLQSISTVDYRAYNGPWRVILETEVRRAAEALGIVPRQGTISRPAERLNGTAGRPSARISPTAARIGGGKRHADDCSCLSCKAPKAVAK